MNVIIKAMRGLFVLVLLTVAVIYTASGQNVNALSLSSNGDTARWETVLVGEKPIATNVTIIAGDTVSLDDTASCAKLTIQQGAILNSISNAAAGNAYWLEAGTGTSPKLDTVDNEGTFGSASGVNDGIALTIPPTAIHLKLLGGGTTAISAIRPLAYNAGLVFDLAQNASLNYSGIAFSALPVIDSNSVADNMTFNVDTGETLKLINPEGRFQGSPADAISGNYTYNIYGTLDLTATKDTQQVVPVYSGSAGAASVTTVNISGDLKLGTGLNSASSGTPAGGTIVFNILNGGLVDATNILALTMGANYFITNGTGALKRSVGNTNITFPVGAPGSSTFSPVTLNNRGVVTSFSVSVKNQFDYPVPNSNAVVNKQWTITPDSAGASGVTVSPEWLAGDQAAGFDPGRSVAVLRYNTNDWVPASASVTGLGTQASPYVASAGGYSAFGIFTLENNVVNTRGLTKLSIYPNPVTHNVNAVFPQTTGNGSLSIVSSAGQKLFSTPVAGGSVSWNADISGWPAGVYILTLQDGGTRTSAKFIKL